MKLSGKRISIGITSGETIWGRRRGKLPMVGGNLSGKRTGGKALELTPFCFWRNVLGVMLSIGKEKYNMETDYMRFMEQPAQKIKCRPCRGKPGCWEYDASSPA